MEDRIKTLSYQIVLEIEDRAKEVINATSFPPYMVGQTFFLNSVFSEGAGNEKFTITEINHTYRSYDLEPENKESKIISMNVILKKIR
ncbi:MAG TPA: hypothetical protein VIK14_02295 [Ignavibacteria bacterium]